jgi:hypothetical protein
MAGLDTHLIVPNPVISLIGYSNVINLARDMAGRPCGVSLIQSQEPGSDSGNVLSNAILSGLDTYIGGVKGSLFVVDILSRTLLRDSKGDAVVPTNENGRLHYSSYVRVATPEEVNGTIRQVLRLVQKILNVGNFPLIIPPTPRVFSVCCDSRSHFSSGFDLTEYHKLTRGINEFLCTSDKFYINGASCVTFLPSLFDDDNIFTGSPRSDSAQHVPKYSISYDGVHWSHPSINKIREGIVRNRGPLFDMRYGDSDLIARTDLPINRKTLFSDWYANAKEYIDVPESFDPRYNPSSKRKTLSSDTLSTTSVYAPSKRRKF